MRESLCATRPKVDFSFLLPCVAPPPNFLPPPSTLFFTVYLHPPSSLPLNSIFFHSITILLTSRQPTTIKRKQSTRRRAPIYVGKMGVHHPPPPSTLWGVWCEETRPSLSPASSHSAFCCSLDHALQNAIFSALSGLGDICLLMANGGWGHEKEVGRRSSPAASDGINFSEVLCEYRVKYDDPHASGHTHG